MNEEIIKKRGKIIPARMPLSVELKKSVFQLIFALLIIIVIVSIVFLMNSSEGSQKGYLIKQYELERNQLLEQGRLLVHEIIKAQSTERLQNSELFKEMVKPVDTIFIE